MTITHEQLVQDAAAATTSITVTGSDFTSRNEGDLLFAILTGDVASAGQTFVDGMDAKFTLLAACNESDIWGALAYYVVGASETGDYTFTAAVSADLTCQMIRFSATSGFPANPIHMHAGTAAESNWADTSNDVVTIPEVNVFRVGTLLAITIFDSLNSSSIDTWPAGYTQGTFYTSGSTTGQAYAYKAQATTQPNGGNNTSYNLGTTGFNQWFGYHVVLQETQGDI